MTTKKAGITLTLSTLAMAVMSSTLTSFADEAGVLAGLSGNVLILRNERKLTATGGDEVYAGDRIESGNGQLFQLLLRDESTFTFGGGSKVTLNDYQYDENTGMGKLKLTQDAGLLKFATGKIADGTTDAFRIVQPATEIAVLGTMGVTAVLTRHEAQVYFPDVNIPSSPDQPEVSLSYSALMGPGPFASIPRGTFIVNAGHTSITVDQPEGSVLAAAGSDPTFFFAPPLELKRPAPTDEESDSDNNTDQKLPVVTTADPANLKRRMHSSSSRTSPSGVDRTPAQQFISEQKVQNLLLKMEEQFGVPEELNNLPSAPLNQTIVPSDNNETTDDTSPMPDPVDPGPIDPLDPGPIDPLDPGPVDPVDPVLVCPGDPACP